MQFSTSRHEIIYQVGDEIPPDLTSIHRAVLPGEIESIPFTRRTVWGIIPPSESQGLVVMPIQEILEVSQEITLALEDRYLSGADAWSVLTLYNCKFFPNAREKWWTVVSKKPIATKLYYLVDDGFGAYWTEEEIPPRTLSTYKLTEVIDCPELAD